MSKKEWMRFHDAQSLLNGEQKIREQIRNGTYSGQIPIEDEWQLDQMVKQARNEEIAGRMFHFDNYFNCYDLESYHVEPENCRHSDEEEQQPARRKFFGLF